MNEEQFKQGLEEGRRKWERRKTHGRVWMGFMLLLVGVLLFLKNANLTIFPDWLFSWPCLIILVGLISGLKHRFRGGFWLILLLIGGFSLINELNPGYDLQRYEWPAIFVLLGILFILRPRGRSRRWRSREAYWAQCQNNSSYAYAPKEPFNKEALTEEPVPGDRHDFVDVTAVFGEVKKNVMTKSFKGGDIVSFMGGSKIDMSQADFQGRVRIDVTNIFGGTKLIVPPTWDVQSDVTAVFGGVDDKRKVDGLPVDSTRVLILDGTCLFGGIEIRSF